MIFAALASVVLGVFPAGDPPTGGDTVRAEVEATLDAMERAALAGDAEAYLRHVWGGEPRHLTEQRAWAADLVAHRPTAFDLSIGAVPGRLAWATEAFGPERAEFVLVMSYGMETGHASRLKDGARAEWPAVFGKHDPDGDGPEPARWMYVGEQWREAMGEGFTVRYFPGAEETVEDVLRAFPVARAHVNDGFGVEPADPQTIVLFDDMEHLKATVYLSMPDTVLGGWNEPGESIKFLTRYARDVRGWTRAFAHEYGHVATWEMGPRVRETPWWLHEGVAELAAEQWDPPGANAAYIRGLAASGGLVAWEEIADYRTARAEVKLLAYRQGHHFIGYISERWGRASRNTWLRALGRGESLDAATRAVFGLPFAELDAAWRATLLGANEPPPPHGPAAAPPALGDAAPADPAAARAQIELTLRAMAAAVLAGDAEAYLDRVWKGDPHWATEQRNWAADLAHHVPTEVAFALMGEPALSDGWAEGEVEVSWRMEGGKPRKVSFDARFARAEGDGGGWLYAGERWDVLERDGVRVLFPRGFDAAAEVVVEVLPEIRAHVHEGFALEEDDLVTRVQEVKLYETMNHLQQSIYLSYTEPLGGWNEPDEAIKLMASGVRGRGGARSLLAHEYGHVATFEFGPQATLMPWWVLEGVAELASEAYSGSNSDSLVRRWARTDALMDWDKLGDFRGEARTHTFHVYRQGHHMVGYVSERFGREGRNTWLRALARGLTLDEASREALGLPFGELDAEWRESLKTESPE
ncbi:MAG: peptidase MA family metallohydrolase [Phycisphaerales bacterium]